MRRRTFIAGTAMAAIAPLSLRAQTPSPVADITKRRVIAGSANKIDGTTAADKLFAELLRPDTKVLYLSIAVEDINGLIGPNQDALMALVAPMGVTGVDLWNRETTESADFAPLLDDYSGIYIGNGNPTSLLERLHSTGLFAPLQEAADRGCVLYGMSAGTMMLGQNALAAASPHTLKNAGDLTSEQIYGLNVIGDRDGNGIIPVPHWRNGRTEMWEDAARLTGLKVLLIPDGSAWTLIDGEYDSIGDEPVIWLEVGQLDI